MQNRHGGEKLCRSSGYPAQRGGRWLAEQGPVGDGEPSKLPEPEPCRDVSYRFHARIGTSQSQTRKMHASEEQVTLRAKAVMLLAAQPQCAIRYPDRYA